MKKNTFTECRDQSHKIILTTRTNNSSSEAENVMKFCEIERRNMEGEKKKKTKIRENGNQYTCLIKIYDQY